MSSCLLPQYDEPLPAFPPTKNRPPRLDATAAKPALFITLNLDPNCALPEVLIPVIDDDPMDLIRMRWLVWGDDGVLNKTIELPALIPNRRPNITAPLQQFNTSLLWTNGMGRRLQLIIADGEFSTSSTGALTTLPKQTFMLDDGGTVDDETYIDTHSWFVDTVTDSTCSK